MSTFCHPCAKKLDSDLGTAIDCEDLEGENYDVLKLIRSKAEGARSIYRRTHAIVQESQKLVEQASIRARDAETRATATEAALKAAEERANRAETRLAQLNAQLQSNQHYTSGLGFTKSNDVNPNPRKTRPKLPSNVASITQKESFTRKMWPFR